MGSDGVVANLINYPLGEQMIVVWEDAAYDLDEVPEMAVATTLGFLVRHDNASITIASERFDDGSYRAFTTIPLVNVRMVGSLRMRG